MRNKEFYIRTNSAKKNCNLDFSLEQIQKLIDPEIFFRINRNYIVNIHSISDIYSYSSNRLKVKLKDFDSDDMIISRDRTSQFKSWMDK